MADPKDVNAQAEALIRQAAGSTGRDRDDCLARARELIGDEETRRVARQHGLILDRGAAVPTSVRPGGAVSSAATSAASKGAGGVYGR